MSSNISSEMASRTPRTPLGRQIPPVGYRFHPTDRELITNHLGPKLRGVEGDNPVIAVADVYKIEPWDLPVWSKIQSKDQVWYFFCSRQQKYKKSKRFSRTTEKGYWKSDGKPRTIKAKGTKKVIGTKRSLIFHIGSSKGIRTKWVMHEYECIPDLKVAQQGDFVLCKLKNKSDEKYRRDDTNYQVAEASNSLNEKPDGMTSESSQNESVTTTTSENLYGMTSVSSYEIGEPSHLVYDSRDRNQDASVTTTTSVLAQSVTTTTSDLAQSVTTTTSDLARSVTTTTSDLASGSDSSFLISSPSQNQHLSGLSVVVTHKINVANTLMPPDSEYQDLDMQDGISISVEDEWSPVVAVSSADFGIQNQHVNSDMLSLDDLMTSDLESRGEPEVVPESSAECRASLDLMRQEAEKQNSSPWMPTYSDQSSSWLLPPVEQDLLDTYYYLCDIELLFP